MLHRLDRFIEDHTLLAAVLAMVSVFLLVHWLGWFFGPLAILGVLMAWCAATDNVELLWILGIVAFLFSAVSGVARLVGMALA